MLTEKSADEILQEAREKDNAAARSLGFLPYNNLRTVSLPKGVDLIGTCPLCGSETHFDNVDQVGELSEVTNPTTGAIFKVNSCEVCKIGREEANSDEKLSREINTKLMKRANQILVDKFDAKLICTKSNMMCSPNELITFKKDGEKYQIPLKVIMLYANDSFEDLEPEFKEAGEDPILLITEDDCNAINKHTGETTYIEDMLLNKERDSILETYEAEVSEDAIEQSKATDTSEASDIQETDESDESETNEANESEENLNEVETNEPENEANEDDGSDTNEYDENESDEVTTDDTRGTEDLKTDESDEGEEIPPESSEVSEEPEEVESDNNISEEEYSDKIELSDNTTEITEDDISEFAEGTSEIIDVEHKETEIVEEEPKEEKSSGSFFDNFFGNNNRSEEETTNEDDDEEGEINIDLDFGSSNPFSVASEVENGKTENGSEVSPIISEAKKEDLNNDIRSIEEDAEDDDEEEIDIDFDSGNREKKEFEARKEQEREKESDENLTNHQDALQDEIKKTKEKNDKWYNNPVFTDDQNQNINEFMDEEDLVSEFKESKLYKVIYQVSAKTNIAASLIIDESTYEIPIVDFQSGLRVICIDCDNVAQMKVHSLIMERNVPFAYPLPKGEKYRKLCLYSDSLNTDKRTKATIRNLIKNVNKEKFNPYRIINLAGNYTLFYTDSIPVIRSFEEENASYPQGKPCTKSIGIIALRPNSGRKDEFTAKDFMNFLNKNYKMDMKNHNLYMVATARYIVQPMPERKVVKYIITEYDELSSTILKDGLDHIVGAIIKEHKLNNTVKDPRFLSVDFSAYGYEFEYEFDASVIPSPSLDIWYDNNDLFRFPDSFEDGQGKCFIRTPEYRESPQDGYRKDPRLFLPIPFSKMFKAEIQKDGINVLNDKMRRQYIERLGFIEAYYPRMKRFILNPLKIMKLELTSSIFGMTKVDLNKFFSGNGIYDGGYDNILMQKFLNSTDMDPQTKNIMNAMMIQKMMK